MPNYAVVTIILSIGVALVFGISSCVISVLLAKGIVEKSTPLNTQLQSLFTQAIGMLESIKRSLEDERKK